MPGWQRIIFRQPGLNRLCIRGLAFRQAVIAVASGMEDIVVAAVSKKDDRCLTRKYRYRERGSWTGMEGLCRRNIPGSTK